MIRTCFSGPGFSRKTIFLSKHDSLTANVSTLDSQANEERTFFYDKQITYVKRKMNKQYTADIMKLAGLTKKKLMHQSFETPEPPHSGLSGAFTL